MKISNKLLALPPHCYISICRVCRQQIVPFKTVSIRVIYAKPTSNNRWDSVKVRLSFKQTHAGHPTPATGLQTDNSSVLPAIITMRWYLVCLKQTDHKTALWYRNIQKSWTLQVFSFSQMHVTDHLQSLMNFIVCIQIHSNTSGYFYDSVFVRGRELTVLWPPLPQFLGGTGCFVSFCRSPGPLVSEV